MDQNTGNGTNSFLEIILDVLAILHKIVSGRRRSELLSMFLASTAVGSFGQKTSKKENVMSTKAKIFTGALVFSGILMLVSIGFVVDVTAGCMRSEASIEALTRRLEQVDKTACESAEMWRKMLLYKKDYGEKLQRFPGGLIAQTFGFPRKNLACGRK